ncbi:transcriptional regulator, GntR family [Tistlia consotensis]|uniref:Transcriptional regulator, GntR family n=1 Tax=Tistlia consotensis USBA 355 TaxID=560819 RepID=A0A1Y6B4A8_9PROT|nr:GntR family transcriptional regulator [Tistlia consotensis]SME91217.1 transcriptional regulator, GntR family [Tistlia consotensis USBA 355]SNR27206.1 transcriptional regulator, GntR family [Tistlia consotensis]
MADENLAIEIANRLRRDILRGALPPGTPIKERDNAAELGVSRTPMREAIRILATERLVVLRPARSPRVASPSIGEVVDQVLVLKTLETLSAELACKRATEADLAEIRGLNDKMSALYESGDSLDLFEIDMAFHAAIVRAAHSEDLAETHRAYLARLWRARYLSARQRRNRDRARTHHDAILAALESRNPRATRAAIKVHLDHLAADIRPILESEQAGQPAEAAK